MRPRWSFALAVAFLAAFAAAVAVSGFAVRCPPHTGTTPQATSASAATPRASTVTVPLELRAVASAVPPGPQLDTGAAASPGGELAVAPEPRAPIMPRPGRQTAAMQSKPQRSKPSRTGPGVTERELRMAPILVSAPRTPSLPRPIPGRYGLDPERLARQIASFEDVMRGVQALPGVSSASDLHGEFFVRGSDTHANVILLDGIPIAFPFHILGLNSIFSPGLVETAEFWSGGAPAEYADATGGVLALRSRGATPSAEHGAVGLSYMSGQLRGAIGGPGLGGVVSLRRSYQAELLSALGAPAGRLIPTFHDAFVRGRWQPARGHLVTVGFLHAGDGMALPRPEISIGDLDFLSTDGAGALERLRQFASSNDRLELHNNFQLGTLMWRAVFGDRTSLETTLGVAPQQFRFALTGDNHESVAIDALTTTLRQDLTWRGKQHRIKTGWLGFRDDTVRHVSAYAGILTLRESNSGINLFDLKERYEIDASRRRESVAVYLQDDWTVDPRFVIGAGSRWQYDGWADRQLWSPRLSLEFRPAPHWSLRGTAGVNHTLRDQPMEVLPTADGSRLQEERSHEATLGVVAEAAPGMQIGMSSYVKRLENLVYEARPAYYANGGEGHAHGLESFVRWEPRGGRALLGLTYAWSQVRQRDPLAWRRRPDYYAQDPTRFWGPVYETPYWYRPLQDQPHRLGVDAGLRFGGWEIATRFQLASGRPYTPVVQIATDPLGVEHGIVGPKGSARYPLYRRLDVRLARELGRGSVRWSLYADILNATGADNVYQYRYDPEYQVRYTVKMLPVLPTLGFEARF